MIAFQSVWGWEPALYLFLGGLGAGTFVAAAVIYLSSKDHRLPVSCAMWTAVLCLCVGLALLLADVVKPFRALAMWQSFGNVGSSWMAIGAWVLFAAVIVFAVCAFMLTDKWAAKIPVEHRRTWANILSPIGILLGLGVAAYTGILLKSAPGVAFWNTGILPCLFTVSALDTGVALMAIIMAVCERPSAKVRYGLEIAAAVLIVVEVAVLVWFLTAMANGGNALWGKFNADYAATAAASADAVLHGSLSFAFWALVVACGLALPLCVAVFEIATAKKAGAEGPAITLPIIGAAGALLGGCALRFVVLFAGAHADITMSAIANML